ncbi:MAG: type IV toxin-antitoxin system AbiEi family antitoxin domain-containing protein [archaeon]
MEEINLGSNKYSYRELVAKGLEIKGVKNWYYGLSTALILNNMTHEYFSIDYILNDIIQRNKPMDIAGHNFIFKKISARLLNFGVIEKGIIFSDPEKTILDIVYLDRYGGVPPSRTSLKISEYMSDADKAKLYDYAEEYPSTVLEFIKGVSS